MLPHSSGCSLKWPANRACNTFQNSKKPNLMKLAVHVMLAGTGKKGSCPPWKHAKVESVEERVERFPIVKAAGT